MAAKTKNRKSRRRKRAGDPITVGGGGGRPKRSGRRRAINPVVITFSDAIYPDPGGIKVTKTYRHLFGAVMRSLVVYINRGRFDLTPLLPSPLDEDECTVTMKSSKGNAARVVISSNELRIRFHTGNYPPEAGNSHASNDSFINKISVRSPLGTFESPVLTGADLVKVVANSL